MQKVLYETCIAMNMNMYLSYVLYQLFKEKKIQHVEIQLLNWMDRFV